MGKRQAKKLEPITLDDLLGNSSMEGLVSFLELPTRSDSLLHSRETITGSIVPPGTVTSAPPAPVSTGSNRDTQPLSVSPFTALPRAPVGSVDDEPTSTVPGGTRKATEDDVIGGSIADPLSTVATGSQVTANAWDSHKTDEALRNLGPYPLPTVVNGDAIRPIRSGAIIPVIYPSAKWITEEGQVVSDKQIRPFRLAQDVLNPNERALYSVLWNSKEARADFEDPNIKIVRAGYETLAKQTNMAKKTIQRLVPRLLSKGFIEISENPNFYNRVAAAYKVFSFKRVLETSAEQGRGHVAKLGHGVAFAYQHPLGSVPSGPAGMVDSGAVSTIHRESPWTRDNGPLSTMDRSSTFIETPNSKEKAKDFPHGPFAETSSRPSSSSLTNAPPNALVQGLRALLTSSHIEIDSDATERLWNQCRRRVPDCTADEVLHFSQAKAVLFSSGKINNPVGFLIFAVPKCFEGVSFHQFRAEQEQMRKAEQEQARRAEQEMEEVQQQLQEMLNNPNSTEEDRQFARRLIGLETK